MNSMNVWNNWEEEIVLEEEEIRSRTRAERRHNSVVKSIRKKRIDERILLRAFEEDEADEKPLHVYSKNMAHTSCPKWMRKSRKITDAVSDHRRADRMDLDEAEFFLGI